MRTHTPYPPANRRHLCALRKLQRLRSVLVSPCDPGNFTSEIIVAVSHSVLASHLENENYKQDVKISPSGVLHILRSHLSSRHVSVN
ncbi:hypothetical protein HF521_015376 [Silurus meridionalis]|uniref:Uncharacterized protein n=1 Tax=Silurus meridionalis TaxID=175797 RepID=A0A8T0A7R3_SILME|nr:hypothetical protein HF521_015376 [Silurus meridionalis]